MANPSVEHQPLFHLNYTMMLAAFDYFVQNYGIQLGINMCQELITNGVPGVHMYTLNLEKASVAILEGVGIVDRSSIPRYL